jgi:inosine-uridine nucleoside N-ribohydrolase
MFNKAVKLFSKSSIMKKLLITLIFLAFTACIIASPLHLKQHHSIIIDTDCNDNDLRAISILLSHPEMSIEAILVSEGKSDIKSGIKKIKSLLGSYNADSIPAGYGSGTESGLLSLGKLLESSDDEIVIVCLGPLTNTAREIKNNPALYKKIEEIVWYTDSASPLRGFNHESDKNAVEYLLNTGIRIDIIANSEPVYEIFDNEIINKCRKSQTNPGKAFYSTFSSGGALKKTG